MIWSAQSSKERIGPSSPRNLEAKKSEGMLMVACMYVDILSLLLRGMSVWYIDRLILPETFVTDAAEVLQL